MTVVMLDLEGLSELDHRTTAKKIGDLCQNCQVKEVDARASRNIDAEDINLCAGVISAASAMAALAFQLLQARTRKPKPAVAEYEAIFVRVEQSIHMEISPEVRAALVHAIENEVNSEARVKIGGKSYVYRFHGATRA